MTAPKKKPKGLDRASTVKIYADFDSSQSWTDREIPVVICEPV